MSIVVYVVVMEQGKYSTKLHIVDMSLASSSLKAI